MEELQFSPRSKETSKRLLPSAAFILAAYWVIFFAPHPVYCAVAIFFIVMAVNEYVSLLQKKNISISRPIMLCLAALAPWSMGAHGQSAYLILALILLFFANASAEKFSQSFTSAAAGLLGLLWIATLFSYVIELKEVYHGAAWVHYAILVTKAGDAGAYFVGRKFGKTKLIHISPKKTWEGSLGQFATSIIISVLSGIYLKASVLDLLLMGAFLGILAQLGDLVESMVKRSLEAKDSGEIPGLGGFLDVLDSLLFTLPFVYFYVVKFT